MPYDPDEIDQFFVIDGARDYYLIPVGVVAGLMAIQLSAYSRYRLSQEFIDTIQSLNAHPG